MKRSIVSLLHLGYWALYLTIVTSVLAHTWSPSIVLWGIIAPFIFSDPFGVGAIISGLLAFYASYFILFDRYLSKKRLPALFLWMITIAVISAIIATAIIKI